MAKLTELSETPENQFKTTWYNTALHVHQPLIDLGKKISAFTGEPVASIIRRALLVGMPTILKEEEEKRLGFFNAAQKMEELAGKFRNIETRENRSTKSRRGKR